ncbi:hypothetical protein ACH5RR_030471 [Cinchona calisaya]|uniref:Remorin C-terminal domain-containing protein n=1 Tax=Cinchona calisaya TaxID=153742 RepID=A0ABD2YUP8_9GENT
MDILFKQLRTKYPNVGQESKEGSSTAPKDRTIPSQKTQSFKGEKKRSQSWLRRQFSGSMSRDIDSVNEGEYQTAVAAAAFAIKSLEESRTREERRKASLAKTKSNTEAAPPVPERPTRSTSFSDEVSKQNLDDPDWRLQISTETSEKVPEKEVIPTPAIKKKVSFTDTLSNNTASSQPENALPRREATKPALSTKKAPSFDKTYSRKPEIEEPKLEIPTPILPPFLPGDTTRQSPKTPGMGDTQAEAWEKEKMTMIKEKYEKLRTTILEWEQKKKTKAKRQLERTEAELDKRRAKAMQHYRSELEKIEGVVRGARSQAAENQRNEEYKAKAKANKFRLTGKLPATCWCF